MNSLKNSIRGAMSGLAIFLPFILLLDEVVGRSQHENNEGPSWIDGPSSHTRLWQGDTPANQRDGRLIFDLEEDYFDNSDPYVMGGSEDVPVHRPFIPFDPLTSLPGVIRRPVPFQHNTQNNPGPQTDHSKPPHHSSTSGTQRRPHMAANDDTSWKWPSDTVRPEPKHTTRPATVAPNRSVTHAQVFLRPEDVPSIRVSSDIIPASHHVVSSHQDGEVNYLNKNLGESSEDAIQNTQQQQQSHESTQVQVVESVGMQPARPASSEEVYGISGELSTLDHVAKTTPMQNQLAKEGGSGGDSVEQTTTQKVKENTPSSSSKNSNVQTSVLSSVGMIIKQSVGHTTTTTTNGEESLDNKASTSSEFSTSEQNTTLRTIRPPVYRTSGLGEVTHYIPSNAFAENADNTHSIHDHQSRMTDPNAQTENSRLNTQAMTVVTRKSITVSTSDDMTASHEITDGSEETGTTTGILGVRVKFTMSAEDERYKNTEESAESDVTLTSGNEHTAATVNAMPSTTSASTTVSSSNNIPTLRVHGFTTNAPIRTVTNMIATRRITNSKPITNTVTRISTTSIVTNRNLPMNSVTYTNSTYFRTTPEMTNSIPTTTVASTVPNVTTINVSTTTKPTTNHIANTTATTTLTHASQTTTRQGKAIAISVENKLGNARIQNNVASGFLQHNKTTIFPRSNTTQISFNIPTVQYTSTSSPGTTTLPTLFSKNPISQTIEQSSSENTVFTTAQDTVPSINAKNTNNSKVVESTTVFSDTTTTHEPVTTIERSSTTDKPTQTLALNEMVSNITMAPPAETTLPAINTEPTTILYTTKTGRTRPITTKRTRISTHANRPFVLPTAPSVLDDPNIRSKFPQPSESSEMVEPSTLEKFSIPTAPSVMTDPTVERATIRHRLRRPLLTRATPGPLWRPTVRSRTNTATLPAITPYPTRSTTSPHPDLHSTMAPPVIQHDDNHQGNGEMEPPDIHKFFEENKPDDTVVITPATTNTIIISSVIGGCAILFFFCLMIFCMCKQKKLRRARYRQPPDYANVFVGKYT